MLLAMFQEEAGKLKEGLVFQVVDNMMTDM